MKNHLIVAIVLAVLLTGSGCMKQAANSDANQTKPDVNQSPSKPNVLFVQLEAFQSFLLDKQVAGQEITPNLNKLIKESAYFPNFFLQNGAGITSDAEFMSNTSLHPAAGGLSIAKDMADKEYPSLPRLLKKNGYSTLTLHTNNVTFWNRKELYSALGFESFYDKEYFGTDKSIAFGSDDDILYSKSMDVLTKQKEPFYAQIVSMSSHSPFRVPASYRLLKLPEIYEGNVAGDYLTAAHYADAALGRFIEELKRKGLWDETVIAIYGDHSGITTDMVKEKQEVALKDLLGRPYDQIDALGVPFIIHGPNVTKGIYKAVGGHMDIMPTLLGLLGIQTEYRMFGYDLFRNAEHSVAVRSTFGPPGSFVYGNEFYDSRAGTLTNIKTRKTSPVPDRIQKIVKEQLNRFKESDELIAALPEKTDSFGVRIQVTEEVKAYSSKDDSTAPVGEISANTRLDTFENDGDWYRIVGSNGKIEWVKTANPITETYRKVYNPVKTRAYVAPDATSKSPIEIGAQNVFVLQEWKGMGWYQVSNWTGKDLWIQIAESD
ncbi:MAG: LTA synthase family protein [Cohnella sp.]|nr:LTA synthase family protein [Cohnella sp.]